MNETDADNRPLSRNPGATPGFFVGRNGKHAMRSCNQQSPLRNLDLAQEGGDMHVGNNAPGTVSEAMVEAVAQAANVEDAVQLTRDGLGIDHVTFHMAAQGGRPTDTPFVRTTYPPQWIARYVVRGYLKVDPVIREGYSSIRPFSWEELEWNAAEREFFADAVAHGLGARGYCVPVVDRLQRRSVLTLNASMPDREWAEFIAANTAGMVRAAQLIHDKALVELSTAATRKPPLAPREIECLLWTARGKEAKAIAAILELSEYTVRSYLRTARRKLECRSLSQAVAKAVQHGMIDP